MNIMQFIREEVTHQGFDIETADGKMRVEWMHEAWEYAEDAQWGNYGRDRRYPDLFDIARIGFLCERHVNINPEWLKSPWHQENGSVPWRKVNITVGGWRIPPKPDQLQGLMEKLQWILEANPEDTFPGPDGRLLERNLAYYYEFEMIHPFADGNGRTGKILYNWLENRLADPVFPVNLFEGGVA